jgi:DNA mismatch endonuclease, patch repair protein
MKDYIRDKRSPTPRSSVSSKVMSAIKAKNTKPEVNFRKALREAGMTGYRIHWKVEGRPDVAYPGKRIAIFIHGCYWHRCPICQLPTPQTNTPFWQEKFTKNVERDFRKNKTLEEKGWTVLTFWECQIKNDVSSLVEVVGKHVNK